MKKLVPILLLLITFLYIGSMTVFFKKSFYSPRNKKINEVNYKDFETHVKSILNTRQNFTFTFEVNKQKYSIEIVWNNDAPQVWAFTEHTKCKPNEKQKIIQFLVHHKTPVNNGKSNKLTDFFKILFIDDSNLLMPVCNITSTILRGRPAFFVLNESVCPDSPPPKLL